MKNLIEKAFHIYGLRSVIARHPSMQHLCGYIVFPVAHQFSGINGKNIGVPVHGGWTASFYTENGEWVIGFDCGKPEDWVTGWAISVERVEAELRRVAKEISELKTVKLGPWQNSAYFISGGKEKVALIKSAPLLYIALAQLVHLIDDSAVIEKHKDAFDLAVKTLKQAKGTWE